MDELYNLPRESLMKRVQWYEKKYGPYYEEKGLKNWRNLFRKPTMYEWVILIMLLMVGFIAWAYSYDISTCKEYINNQTDFFNTFYNQSNSQGELVGGVDIDWGVNNVNVEG